MTSPTERGDKAITMYLAGGQSITVVVPQTEVRGVMDKVSSAWAGRVAGGEDPLRVGDHMIRPSAVTGLRIRDAAEPRKTPPTDFAEASTVLIAVLDNVAMGLEGHREALGEIADAIRVLPDANESRDLDPDANESRDLY